MLYGYIGGFGAVLFLMYKAALAVEENSGGPQSIIMQKDPTLDAALPSVQPTERLAHFYCSPFGLITSLHLYVGLKANILDYCKNEIIH